MDISKYIGQFLLKNNYCYIHGLGNLELVKKPAVHDGKNLLPSSYEVIVTSGGSIDDSFANFIATNEQISISKAANALRDFSINSRTELAAGKDVLIEGIGKFIEVKGKINFVTDPNFIYAPTGMPAIKNSKQLEEQKLNPPAAATYPEPKASGSVNWTSIILGVLLLALIGGGIYGIYYYNSTQKKTVTAPVMATVDTPVVQQIAPAIPDTMPQQVDSTQQVAPPAAETTPAVDTVKRDYKVVINEYNNRSGAEKKYRALKLNGLPVTLKTTDSVNYQLVLKVKCLAADTTHYLDSLRIFYGGKRTYIIKE